MRRTKLKRILAIGTMFALFLSTISVPMANPVYAAIPDQPNVQASIQAANPAAGASGAYTFELIIKAGTVIPRTLNIAVPDGYSKNFNSATPAGSLQVVYKGITASGDVYGGAPREVSLNGGATYEYKYSVGTTSTGITVAAVDPGAGA